MPEISGRLNASGGPSGFLKLPLSPQLHRHGQQAQGCIAQGGGGTESRQRLPEDPGIIPHGSRSQDRRHGGEGHQCAQCHGKGPVPVVEAVNREGRSPPKKASPRAHGIRLQRQSGDHPCDQHGEDPQAVHAPPNHISLACPPANALLGQADASGLQGNPRDEAEQDGEGQGEPGAHPAKQIDHLVRRDHLKHGLQPHGCNGSSCPDDKAKDEALHCQVVSQEVLSQNRHAEVMIGAVIQSEQKPRRNEAEVEGRPPAAPALDTVGEGAAIAQPQKHGMGESCSCRQDRSEEQEIHCRVAALKAHRLPPCRTGPSPGPAFPARGCQRGP